MLLGSEFVALDGSLAEKRNVQSDRRSLLSIPTWILRVTIALRCPSCDSGDYAQDHVTGYELCTRIFFGVFTLNLKTIENQKIVFLDDHPGQ